MAPRWTGPALAFAMLAACGDSSSGDGDTTPADTTPADTTPADTTPADTTPADTGADTTPADTTPADTTPADTTPADTGMDTADTAEDTSQCVAAGGSVPVIPNAPECCAGLALIPCDAPDADGACMGCDGASFCASCGDGTCGPGENECNCADDCATACIAAGCSVPVIPDAPECCPGLAPIGCDTPDADGACSAPCVGASICASCGDGACGSGENACNCADDCAAACVAEGGSVPVIPNAPECCAGLALIPCDTPDADGACSAPCAGASICARCGDSACGSGENKCNCPIDCD